MKKYLFIVIALGLFSFIVQASPARASVAYVTFANAVENTNTVATTSITVSGSNPVLVIGTSLAITGGAGSTTNVTFSLGGTPLLIASKTDSGPYGYADVWCIAAPPAGTGIVTANFASTGGTDNYLVAAVFSGADQSNPCPSANAVTFTSGSSNTSSTLTAGGLVSGDASFGMVGLYNSGDVTSPYMKNNLIYQNVGAVSDMESGYSTSTASIKASWNTGAGSYKDFIDVRIQQPTASLPTINSFSAAPTVIKAGGTSTLSWSTTGATSLSISPTIGTVTGTSTTTPATSTTAVYTPQRPT